MSTKQLQKDLIELGFGSIVGSLDGHPGPKTTKAVKAMQKAYGLIEDGIAGPKTQSGIQNMKGNAGKWGTQNFHISEFTSPDTGGLPDGGMSDQLLLSLEYLRWKLGNKTIHINSGYRTKTFNSQVGGYRYSNHLTGRAADIRVIGVSPSKVQSVAAEIFNGLGRYKNFTHVDTDNQKVHFTGAY